MSKNKTSGLNKLISSAKEIFTFLYSKTFVRQLSYIALFVIAIFVITILWLRSYTNHGQKLTLPDYVGADIADAVKDAERKSFKIIVNDSIHIVGKNGGEIIDQNPKPDSKVKENRKIYVTITKYLADVILSGELPVLYGNQYDQKKLELQHRNINCKVKDFKYDSGEPNHILEVWYDGEIIADKETNRKDVRIEKGSTLEFVLSNKEGGSISIPDLRCNQLDGVKFILSSNKLKLGEIRTLGDIEDEDKAYVVAQFPFYDPTAEITRGDTIDVTIVQEKPADCVYDE